MTKAEAAQKWAEANEALEVAAQAFAAAEATHKAAHIAEQEAWAALEEFAGRKPVEVEPEPEILYSTGGPDQPTTHVRRHDLQQRPLG